MVQLPLSMESISTNLCHVINQNNGFDISRSNKFPVKVRFYPTFLVIEGIGKRNHMLKRTDRKFGFYECRKIANLIAAEIKKRESARTDSPGAERSAEQLGRTVFQILNGRRATWLSKAESGVLAVHRSVFDATGATADLAMSPTLYTASNRYLIKDVVQFPAAAIALKFANRSSIDAFDQEAQIRRAMSSVLPTTPVRPRNPSLRKRIIPENLLFDRLQNWMSLFSPEGQANRSLRRTLVNLPPGIPGNLLINLRNLELPRPIFAHGELLVA